MIPIEYKQTIIEALEFDKRRHTENREWHNMFGRGDATVTRIECIDAALEWLAQQAEQPRWSYSGPATIETRGGGFLAMRMHGPFPQGRPEDGKQEVELTFTIQPATE